MNHRINKSINHFILIALLLICSIKVNAQNSGVNSKPANGASILDLSNNPNKALVLPRVNLLSTTDVVTIPSPAPYTMAYATTSNGVGPTAIIANNLYIFDGKIWKRLTLQNALNTFDLAKVLAAGFNNNDVPVSGIGANVKTNMNLITEVDPNNLLASDGAFTAPKDGFYSFTVGLTFFGNGYATQGFFDTPFIIATDLTGFSFRMRGNVGQETLLGTTGTVYLTGGTTTSGFQWSKGNNTGIITQIRKQSVIWEYLGAPVAIP